MKTRSGHSRFNSAVKSGTAPKGALYAMRTLIDRVRFQLNGTRGLSHRDIRNQPSGTAIAPNRGATRTAQRRAQPKKAA